MKSLKLKTKIPVKKKIGSRPYNVPRKTLLHVTRKFLSRAKRVLVTVLMRKAMHVVFEISQ